MYIKEDTILPVHYTFYDFIVTKARGKSGPLFHFDVHDDVRLVNDSRIEKDESHPGKIVKYHGTNATNVPSPQVDGSHTIRKRKMISTRLVMVVVNKMIGVLCYRLFLVRSQKKPLLQHQ